MKKENGTAQDTTPETEDQKAARQKLLRLLADRGIKDFNLQCCRTDIGAGIEARGKVLEANDKIREALEEAVKVGIGKDIKNLCDEFGVPTNE